MRLFFLLKTDLWLPRDHGTCVPSLWCPRQPSRGEMPVLPCPRPTDHTAGGPRATSEPSRESHAHWSLGTDNGSYGRKACTSSRAQLGMKKTISSHVPECRPSCLCPGPLGALTGQGCLGPGQHRLEPGAWPTLAQSSHVHGRREVTHEASREDAMRNAKEQNKSPRAQSMSSFAHLQETT